MATNIEEFTAGFGEGDMCIQIPKPSKKIPAYPPRVVFYQSKDAGVPVELTHIQAYYGGKIFGGKQSANPAHRKAWVLAINHGAEKILADLAEYSNVKRLQAAIALEYFKLDKRASVAVEYREKLRAARLASDAGDFHVLIDRITSSYLAGLFAADGSVGIYRDVKGWFMRAEITSQKTNFLCAICIAIGGGGITKARIAFAPNMAGQLYDEIRPHLIGPKGEQFDLSMELQRKRKAKLQSTPFTVEENEEIERLAKRIKALKKG